jgi:hypothetical protein
MRWAKILAILAALGIVAAAVVFVVVRARIGEAPDAPPTGSRVEGVERPFGATAPWNVPVAGLPLDPRSDDWRDRLWRWAVGNNHPDDPDSDPNRGRFGVEFGFDDAVGDFAVPVYSAADATTTMRVRQRDNWKGGFTLGPEDRIPWNPGWRPAGGSDAKMVIIDPETGRHWSLWGLVAVDEHGRYNDSQCLSHLLGIGYDRRTDLCAGGATLTVDSSGAPVDYRTYTGNDPQARGVGIQELAMLVLPEEVESGAIRHALSMVTYNTLGGPVCGPEVVDTSSPEFGVTCANAVAPAGQLESLTGGAFCGPDAQRGDDDDTRRTRAVPEGMRFALHVTDAEIDAWLDQRGYEGELRRTARIFAVALRDYGWMITGTTCFSAELLAAGATNPATAKQWRDLGIADTGKKLLSGLFTRERIVAIAPAVNECSDRPPSRFSCPADDSHY